MSDSTKPLHQTMPRSGVIVVTGTDTGVGKTIASAAVASMLASHGVQSHIYKPIQTGLISEHDPRRTELEQLYDDIIVRGDAQVAGELSNCSYSTGAAFALPMAPQAAAAAAQEHLPTACDHVARIRELLRNHDVVIVEGAGGLLVDLGDYTLADIACQVQEQLRLVVYVVVVVHAQLGTLNHTALTIEALRHRGLHRLGVVIGSWPARPTPVESSNHDQLEHSYPLLAALPHGAGIFTPETFQSRAPSWFISNQRAGLTQPVGARSE